MDIHTGAILSPPSIHNLSPGGVGGKVFETFFNFFLDERCERNERVRNARVRFRCYRLVREDGRTVVRGASVVVDAVDGASYAVLGEADDLEHVSGSGAGEVDRPGLLGRERVVEKLDARDEPSDVVDAGGVRGRGGGAAA